MTSIQNTEDDRSQLLLNGGGSGSNGGGYQSLIDDRSLRRTRSNLDDGGHQTCPTCKGSGRVDRSSFDSF